MKQKELSFFGKRLRFYVIFVPIILILYACPFSSPYKLDEEASIPVDEMLLGNWATMSLNKSGRAVPVKMIISKKNETEYNIEFTGYLNDLKPYRVISNDSIKGTAFMSLVANRPYLNIEVKGMVFISAMVYKNDTLSLMPIADGFTAKYIKSDSQLRSALEVHIRGWLNPRYDEQFCLKDMVRVN